MTPPRHGQVFRHPIPAIIAPPDRRCVVFYIPDDWEHITAFWGTVSTLIYWWNWERDAERKGTEVAQVWRDVFLDARERFLRGECGEGCEDCPPEKPERPVNGGGGSSEVVGQLGLTIEEMESIIMGCLDISGSIKWDSTLKTFVVWSCHDGWVPIQGMVGAVATSEQLGVAAMTLDEWINSGAPTTAPVENIIHDRAEIYTTDDSLKCAKATAIVEHIWQSMEGWVGVAEDFPNTVRTSIAFGGLITSWFPFVSIPLNIVGQAFATFLNIPSATVVSRLQTDIAKTAQKQTLICDLVPRMASPGVLLGAIRTNRMTDADIKIAFERFEEIVSPHETTRELLGFFPVSEWKQAGANRMQSEECGCEAYLPFDYAPPLSPGSFRYELLGFANYPIGAASPSYVAGVAPPDMNTPVGTGSDLLPKTVYQETQSGGYWNKVHAVYEMSEPVIVSGFKADLVWASGEPTVDVRMGVMCYRSDTNVWQALIADFTDTPPINQAIIASSGNIPSVTHMAIYMRARNLTSEGTPKHVTISNPRIDGNFDGQGFLELLPGEEFTP